MKRSSEGWGARGGAAGGGAVGDKKTGEGAAARGGAMGGGTGGGAEGGGGAVGKSKCSPPQDVLLQHAITEYLITWILVHHLRHKWLRIDVSESTRERSSNVS